MHVLVVNIHFAPETYGGATVVAEEVARALVRAGRARVTAVSATARADLAPYAVLLCEREGIANYMINLPPGRSYAEHYANPQVAERIAGIARMLQPDLAHLHCLQELGADCIPALKALGLPVVLSVHDYWWLCERQFMFRPDGGACPQDPVRTGNCRGCVDDLARARTREDRLRALAGMADIVTAPSHHARDLCARSGLAGGRIAIWENGVTPPRPDYVSKQARRRAADSRTVFGFVGGPSRLKGWPQIEAAFSGLGRSDFRGVVVEGTADGSWWRHRSLARLDGDWSVVPRFGQERLDDFYAAIDVLLFPSQWNETFGLTLREAFSRGVRVIQTASGGAIEHGRQDAATILPAGAGADALRHAVLAELDRPARGAEARAERSWADQAAAFFSLARPLLEREATQIGAA